MASKLINKDVLNFTKDHIDKQLASVTKKLKAIDTLKERKQSLENLQSQSKNLVGSDNIKQFTINALEKELAVIDKRVKTHDKLKAEKDSLTILCNQVNKK